MKTNAILKSTNIRANTDLFLALCCVALTLKASSSQLRFIYPCKLLQATPDLAFLSDGPSTSFDKVGVHRID